MIDYDKSSLEAICRRYGVRRLSFFGSVTTPHFREDSDVDVLVEFPEGARPNLLTLGGIQQDVSALLGRFADVKTPAFLSRHFRQEVLDTALAQYEDHGS